MLKQVVEVYELLDSPKINGSKLHQYFVQRGCKNIKLKKIKVETRVVEFINILIPGMNGKSSGGNAPTIGILGQLGGIGAYPEIKGFVSDGDGALVALSCALKLLDMVEQDCYLEGDTIITTHICTTASIRAMKLVPFLDMPLPMEIMLENLVDLNVDAILSVDTTKGNRILNQKGLAITPTVKEGYILKVSDDLLDIMSTVTGLLPSVIAITTQDITSYNNGIYHINSIMQPTLKTNAPVVGVAITTQTPVAGIATGATHFTDIEMTARFCIETAKYYGEGKCRFYDKEEFKKLVSIYGKMNHLQEI